MEVSPLPHKIPNSFTYEINLQSPTPEHTPADTPSVTSDPSAVVNPGPDHTVRSLPLERRKSGPPRPSLARVKGFSTNAIPQRPSLQSQPRRSNLAAA